MDKKPYYISTAIAYTAAKPHIGNTYEIVLADAIARYKRMTGYDVYFQTGTDEHGQKIQEKAEAAGIMPQQHVDKVAGEVKTIWDLMNTTYDKFIRTTDPMHEKKVQKIFKKLYDQGDIYKGAYKGKYCKPCESFWTESQLLPGLRPPVRRRRGGGILLPHEQVRRPPDEAHRGAPRVHPAGEPQERDGKQLPQAGPAGPVRFPYLVQLGHSGRL